MGRSNHSRGGIPAGRLYPTTRDELVECAALLRGARSGRLDALQVPDCPLDILAQQMVAECAAEDWAEDDLLALVRQAAPFAGLTAEDFDEVAELVSEGIRTGRGRRAAYLHRDRVTGRLRAGGAPGWPRSPRAGPSPSWATTGCWPNRTTPWSAR